MTLSPLYVMSIDPGLDQLALATFRVDPRVSWHTNDLVKKCSALQTCTLIKTKPEWPLQSRLTVLAKELRTELAYLQPDRLLIEQPAMKGGSYQRMRGSNGQSIIAGSMDEFFQALGVITMVATELLGTKVVRMVRAAAKQKKTDRQAVTRHALTMAGKLEAAKFGSDRLDAIFIGASAGWGDLIEPDRAPARR